LTRACKMKNMENFCVEWDQFDVNIRKQFRKIREDQRLFDVTLATEDGKQIQAHKIILSSGSEFFSDIFLKSNHRDMLIYLRGIKSDLLEHITDFIYSGETFIALGKLEEFLQTAKELQVKGLKEKFHHNEENNCDEQQRHQDDNDSKEESKNIKNVGDVEQIDINIQNVENIENGFDFDFKQDELVKNEEYHLYSKSDSFNFDSQEDALMKNEENNLNTNDEVDSRLENIIEKSEGIWRCKGCGKTGTHKGHMRVHAETHIEGVAHDCHMCNKTFSNRPCLKQHMRNIHSEQFSCEVCGMTGMHRQEFRRHKQRFH